MDVKTATGSCGHHSLYYYSVCSRNPPEWLSQLKPAKCHDRSKHWPTSVWPDWATSCCLGDFVMLVATIFSPNYPHFWALFEKMSKSFIFKWKNFGQLLFDIRRLFIQANWSHCPASNLFSFNFPKSECRWKKLNKEALENRSRDVSIKSINYSSEERTIMPTNKSVVVGQLVKLYRIRSWLSKFGNKF